jgi:hemoglobin
MLLVGSCVIAQQDRFYTYLPSRNFIPSYSFYNFDIYEDPKLESKVAFVDQTAVPNDQLNDGGLKYYEVNFSGDPVKLHSLKLSADSQFEEYVTRFRLKTSADGVNWQDVNNGEVFQGLKSKSDSVVFPFMYTTHAKFIRFIIVQYFSRISLNLAIRYNEIEKPKVLPEYNSIAINVYKPSNGSETFPQANIPASFTNYANDRFNNVHYYASSTDNSRNTNFPKSPNHTDQTRTSPQALLAHPQIITEILTAFFDQYLVTDPYLGRFFTGINVAHHKKMVVEFFRSILGGDVEYTGKDMTSAHKGMDIIHKEFDSFMRLLLMTFMSFHVDEDVLQEVSSKLEFYRSQIIGK